GTAGQRCGQTPFELSRLGHFQASVLPFALTPRLLEPWLQPYLVCSNRFLSLNQHLVQTYEKMTQELHSPGLRTFLIWISASVKSNEEKYNQVPKEYATWSNSIRMTHEVMTSHTAFLNSTGLIPFHQTFLLGLSNNSLNTTAFVRFDGQTKTKLTDLTLDSPGQRGQTSIADLLRDQQQKIEKDSPFIYSEFNDKNQSKNISTIAPEIKSNSETNRSGLEFIVSHHALRRAIVNSRRHVICQSVAASQGNARILVKVSLNVRATENRLPQLMYEEMAKSNLPNSTDSLTIQECLKNARELLTESVYRDVSLRDSSAFRTLITGLPVKSIRAASTVMDMASEVEEEAFDKSTSALPAVPNEDEE
ncbi:hypothetical protein EBU99_12715, partial [bacterium]|nr:hypothetical protein [bacterium]